MLAKTRWIALVLFVVAALAAGACGKKTTITPAQACLDDHIDCGTNPAVTCDNRDEVCKCGPVEYGLVCGENETCTPQGENQFACVSNLCDLKTCDNGESCNPTTGECACGEGEAAKHCDATQKCENGHCTPDKCDGVDCNFGLSCDPTDGSCKCGGQGGANCSDTQICVNNDTCMDAAPPGRCDPIWKVNCGNSGACSNGVCQCGTGSACEAGQYCKDGGCVTDPCYGVNCPLLTKCNPDDSACHCIGTDDSKPAVGPVCSAGQACTIDGSCLEVDPCKNVTCPIGTVCDPSPEADVGGVCRCGGIGPDYPKCGSDQSCDLTKPACVGGQPCKGVKCDISVPGTSCDPEDGFCKCGGLGGDRCHDGDVCLTVDAVPSCVAKCDPLAPACTGDAGCYYNPNPGSGTTFAACLPAGTVSEGQTCTQLNDCSAGLTCAPVGTDQKKCVKYCDLNKQSADCPKNEFCIRLAPTGDLGQCFKLAGGG